jgi:penicillin-binding protein 2
MVRSRLRILGLLLGLPFVVLICRLWSIQIADGAHLGFWLQSQHTSVTFVPPLPGRILDRHGRLLAGNRAVFDLHFVYRELNPRAAALEAICRELSRWGSFPPPAEVEAHLRHLIDAAALAASPDLAAEPVLLIERIPAGAAARLRQRLKKERAFFIRRAAAAGEMPFGDPAESGAKDGGLHELWVRPREAMVLEMALHRLAGLTPAASYGDLLATVEKTLRRIDQLVERYVARDRIAGRRGKTIESIGGTARQGYLAQEWPLVTEVDLEVVTAIEYHPERFPGIRAADRTRRVYPLGESAGALVGHLGRLSERDLEELEAGGYLLDEFTQLRSAEAFEILREGGRSRLDLKGVSGLEASHDARLRGKYGMRVVQVDHQRRPRQVLLRMPPENGPDLRTTLDAPLQELLYEQLRLACRPRGGAAAGSAAVMELPSGALLASAGFPGIDPNRLREPGYSSELEKRWGAQTKGWFLDRPQLHALYPGSIFKVITAIAALESGRDWEGPVDPWRTYPCSHEFEFNRRLRCSSRYGHSLARRPGEVDLHEALQFSCNSYFYYLGLKHLDAGLLSGWAAHFGFGRPTGIDLPSHSLEKGRLHGGAEVRGQEICHYAIGQVHVEATPLQVLRAMAAIALDGKLLPRPYLAEPSAPEPLPPLGERTLAAVREGMRRAAGERGGTVFAKSGLERFQVALKTGTAQFRSALPLHHAWIAGFGPLSAPSRPGGAPSDPPPRFAFVVVLEETPEHGGDACAPIVAKLLEHLSREAPELRRGGAAP